VWEACQATLFLSVGENLDLEHLGKDVKNPSACPHLIFSELVNSFVGVAKGLADSTTIHLLVWILPAEAEAKGILESYSKELCKRKGKKILE
jgi:hypothetical protein